MRHSIKKCDRERRFVQPYSDSHGLVRPNFKIRPIEVKNPFSEKEWDYIHRQIAQTRSDEERKLVAEDIANRYQNKILTLTGYQVRSTSDAENDTPSMQKIWRKESKAEPMSPHSACAGCTA